MPIQNGKYVAPTWYNDTNPPINAAEMQDICDSIAKLPVKNGGTGATSASGALNNLGALAVSKVAGIGNSYTPVYFNSSGTAKPMTGQLPISLGGTGMDDTTKIYGGEDEPFLIVKWGKVVMLRYRAYSPVRTQWSYDLSTISAEILPRTAIYVLAQGVSISGDVTTPPRIMYNAVISTDGTFVVRAPQGNTYDYYPRFTTTWLAKRENA